VKGSGIAILKKYEIVKGLEDTFDTGSTINEDGALYAIFPPRLPLTLPKMMLRSIFSSPRSQSLHQVHQRHKLK
jgi:hypothetical protein